LRFGCIAGPDHGGSLAIRAHARARSVIVIR
jgi:hypothetical protein